MGYNNRPEDFSQVDRAVDLYESLGVDRLGTWTYRGGLGTSVAAKDPLELWDAIGRNYRRVLKNSAGCLTYCGLSNYEPRSNWFSGGPGCS